MATIANIPYLSGIPFSVPLTLDDPASNVGIVFSNEIIGGYQEFATIEERDNIPLYYDSSVFTGDINEDNFSSGRRRVGMLAYVVDENKTYRLIPYGFFNNGGTKNFTDWSTMSTTEKLLRLDPRQKFVVPGTGAAGYGFKTIVG